MFYLSEYLDGSVDVRIECDQMNLLDEIMRTEQRLEELKAQFFSEMRGHYPFSFVEG